MITHKILHELAQWNMSNPKADVLSVYVDLTPSRFATPRARSTELHSLMREANAKVPRDHLCLVSLHKQLDVMLADQNGAMGLAYFCAPHLNLDQIVKLPEAAGEHVIWGHSAYIRPLLEFVHDTVWMVCLLDRREARLLIGNQYGIHQVARIVDDVPGQHDQGGLAQARYRRSIEQNVHEHLVHVCKELFTHYEAGDFDRLIIIAQEEMQATVCHHLHPYLNERLDAYIGSASKYLTREELLEKVCPVFNQYEQEQQAAHLQRFHQALGRQERSTQGLVATLAAINERKVESLWFRPQFTHTGMHCPRCNLLYVQGKKCPVCENNLIECQDVVEKAIEHAICQGAKAYSVQDEALEDIGALTRF